MTTIEGADWATYESGCVREETLRITRLLDTVLIPHLKGHPDDGWKLLEPLLPPPASTTPTGRHPEAYPRREIVDGIRYLVDNGCKWRALPSDVPPFKTVYGFFARWAKAGVLEHVRDQLRRRIRVDAGRYPRPVTAIMDSPSVKAAETVSRDTRGFDGATLINGRKRT
ncbi:hypothetical protein GCM10010112_84920 [Actinoplanes lobatus]|uniref:Transposase n=1 Tax=Actinoplanes lobatus TaxID=113568 RepID=A0A7W7MJI5_9ACTN|nr:transposase [Actinoplanes lobatus]GGN95047.1 hypothetical protein GCM10010112_84920 [Actinoplanes lobatus]GIE46109.1 hypothetical protein Alo02nite_90070 [Actinoplanes lobatus]